MEYQAGEAAAALVHAQREHTAALEVTEHAGEQRVLSQMQPRLAELKGQIQQLQDELWQCTRDNARREEECRQLGREKEALQAQVAKANIHLREVHEHARQAELLPKIEMLRAQMDVCAHSVHAAASDSRVSLQVCVCVCVCV